MFSSLLSPLLSHRISGRALLAVVLLSLAVFAEARVAIDGVRVYRAPEYTRFVFDVSAPPAYQVLPDIAPGRVVIDFRDADIKASLEAVDLQDSPVRRVRSGQQAYKDMARFWGRLFLINFAMGVATGIMIAVGAGMLWLFRRNNWF